MYDDIKEQFKKVISYSQNIDYPKVDILFDKWLKAKKYFIDSFGGLIKEIPNVSFTLSEKTKNNNINDFCDYIEGYSLYDLSNFIDEEREGFYDNETKKDYWYKGQKIPKGMKLVKAFKYFIDYNPNFLSEIQDKASRIIQEDKISGTLCFSVHPLDFLSVSENNYNWRSCHALDGDYRAGNLSYMTDSSTFICYLKGEDDVILPRFPSDVPWNNKKWRVLLYISNDYSMMMAGRQYPFFCEGALDQLAEYLDFRWPVSERFIGWSKFTNSKINSVDINENHIDLALPYYVVGHSLVAKTKLVKDLPGSLQYNDLLYSTCYEPYYAYGYDKEFYDKSSIYTGFTSGNNTRFSIGGAVPCLKCEDKDIEHNHSMLCDYCYNEEIIRHEWVCSECGNIYNWDMAPEPYEVEGQLVCEDCFDEYCAQCDECGELFFISKMKEDQETHKIYCPECWEKIRSNN